MKKRDIITIGILVFIFTILLVILFLSKDEKKEEKKEETEFPETTILTDENTFISIEKNINKIYDNSNVFNYVVKNDLNYENYMYKSFSANQIKVISKSGLYKYFIKGSLYKIFVNEKPTFLYDEYMILNYDINNGTYNIEIIDKESYENISKKDLIFETININEYNRFKYSTLSPKTRAIMYFNDYLDKVYTSSEEAYNLLSETTIDEYFNTYEDFKSFISKQGNITLSEYSVNEDKIGIKDKNKNEYIFEINGILKYEVTIILAEE